MYQLINKAATQSMKNTPYEKLLTSVAPGRIGSTSRHCFHRSLVALQLPSLQLHPLDLLQHYPRHFRRSPPDHLLAHLLPNPLPRQLRHQLRRQLPLQFQLQALHRAIRLHQRLGRR